MYIYLNCRLRSFEHFQYSNHCFFSFAVINAKIQCTPAMKEIAVGLQYNLNGFQMPQIAANCRNSFSLRRYLGNFFLELSQKQVASTVKDLQRHRPTGPRATSQMSWLIPYCDSSPKSWISLWNLPSALKCFVSLEILKQEYCGYTVHHLLLSFLTIVTSVILGVAILLGGVRGQGGSQWMGQAIHGRSWKQRLRGRCCFGIQMPCRYDWNVGDMLYVSLCLCV